MPKLLIHQERSIISKSESLKEHAHQTMSTSKASQEKKKIWKREKEKKLKNKKRRQKKKKEKKVRKKDILKSSSKREYNTHSLMRKKIGTWYKKTLMEDDLAGYNMWLMILV